MPNECLCYPGYEGVRCDTGENMQPYNNGIRTLGTIVTQHILWLFYSTYIPGLVSTASDFLTVLVNMEPNVMEKTSVKYKNAIC